MLIDGRYETLEEKNLYVTGEILRILSEIPHIDHFSFMKLIITEYQDCVGGLCI